MKSAAITLSHSPLMGSHDPSPEVLGLVEEAFDEARGFVEQFQPDVVVLFAPDHYNGVFYDLMPAFCIGFGAHSVGDWLTSEGPLSVDRDTARFLAERVLEADIDLALSERMEVDHGFAQPLEVVFGGLTNVPVVPIFINCAAEPLGPVRRISALGRAVGEAMSSLDKRVLFMGSGGLSHDPPVPRLAEAAPDVAEMLIAGRNPDEATRNRRETNVIRTGREFAAGSSSIMPLNPQWDNDFLDLMAAGRFEDLERHDNQWFVDNAGHAAHEVRTWIAAYAALASTGAYSTDYRFYHPIPEWIAGFGLTIASTKS